MNSAIPDRMFRTIKIRLERTDELVETVSVFNQACQRALDWRYENKEFNRMLGDWSLHELIRFVQYKAEALGKQVIMIDPHYTPQTCSKCDHVSPSNRNGR